MSFPTRIVVAIINFISLVVTLIYPNTATPISILPVVIGVTTWAFFHYNEYKEDGKKKAKIVVWTTVILSCISVLLFVTCELNNHVFKFKEDVAYLSGKTIEYYLFAIPTFVVTVLLMVAEFSSLKYGKIEVEKNFEQYVKEAV